MRIKFYDENLVGQPGLSRYMDPGTEWKRDIDDYDLAIYVDRMCFVEEKNKDKNNIAWIIEPPIINGENYTNILKNIDSFKYIFTHNKDIINKGNTFVYVPHGGTWLREEDISIFEKNNLVSYIFSSKQWNSYHRLRFNIYEKIKTNQNIKFFGSGCNNPIDFKISGLKDFMFSIVVENSIESGYFTEKLLDCFLTGTIPIYIGSKDTELLFDPNGMFYFEGDSDIEKILGSLSPELYYSKIDAVKKNFELAKKYIFPEKIITKFLEENV